MQKTASSLLKSLPPIVLSSSLMLIYLRTLAPGLSWANGGTDGGDLIAAAATGGIAHPTGYPLYLLLARLFQFLPLGSLAYRTNLMSALFTSLAAVLVYEIVAKSSQSPDSISKTWAGLAAGSAFGLAPLVWSQALITEVYALQSFLIALIIYFYSVFQSHSSWSDTGRGLLMGLAVSNHVTAVLLLPILLLMGSYRSLGEPLVNSGAATPRFDWASLRRQVLGLALGLSPYSILPLRALAGPPLNWGYPVTLRNFWWLVSGQLYQGYYFRSSLSEVWGQVQSAAALLFEQFGSIGVALGLLGLVLFRSRSRLYALTSWIALTSLVFALFYRAEDSYLYLIPTFLCFAIWVGRGAAGTLGGLGQRAIPWRLSAAVLVIGFFLFHAFLNVGEVDASQDLEAESFGTELLSAAPENAILFAEGDQAVFALWYFHFALGERPDLAIVAEDLLHFDWYQRNLKDVYPELVLPGAFPWPESIALANPWRVTCYADFTKDVPMECSEAARDR